MIRSWQAAVGRSVLSLASGVALCGATGGRRFQGGMPAAGAASTSDTSAASSGSSSATASSASSSCVGDKDTASVATETQQQQQQQPQSFQQPQPPRRQLRRHPKMFRLINRELKEEYLRDHRPPLPHVPTGWQLHHEKGSNRFDLKKTVEVRNSGPEHLHIIALMERKLYEHTYRMDTGEREEEEHLTFSLFINKERWQQQQEKGGGGLEFTLTSIDQELVFDNLAIHSMPQDFEHAKVQRYSTQKNLRDVRYRGPMVMELDDELTDEILDYLDERGINNGFAEYMMSQAHYFEQHEYEEWLSLLKTFSQ